MLVDRAFNLQRAGGVYYDDERVDTLNGSAMAFIGLGGTGIDAMLHVKDQVHMRTKLPKVNGVITSDHPANTAFLGIDSHIEQLEGATCGNTSINVNNETCGINAGPHTNYETILNNYKAQKKAGAKYVAWLSDNTTAAGGETGCNGKRDIGRMALFNSYANVKNAIINLCNTLHAIPGVTRVTFFVFNGISGGTGSGTFIDVGLLIREIMHPTDKVYDYVIMPDVNVNSGGSEALLKSMGYGALKELEYFYADGKDNPDKLYTQEYDASHTNMVSKNNPYNLVHIINSKNSAGRTLTKEEVFNSLAHSVFSYIAKESIAAGAQATFESVYDNVEAHMHVVDGAAPYPAAYRYLSLGGSMYRMPYMEINTLLACRMFEKLAPTFVPNIDQNALDDVMDQLGFGSTYDIENTLGAAITSGAFSNQHTLDVAHFPYNAIWNNSSNQAERAARDDWANYQNVVEANTTMMASYTAAQHGGTLEYNLKQFLKSAIADPQRGPVYVFQALAGHDSQVGNVLDLLISFQARFHSLYVQERNKKDRMEAECNSILAKNTGLAGINVLGRYNAAKEYLFALNSWREQCYMTDKYAYLSNLLESAINIYKIYIEYVVKPLHDLVVEMREVFSKNLIYLNAVWQDVIDHPEKRDKSLIMYPLEFEAQATYKAEFDNQINVLVNSFYGDILNNLNVYIKREIDNVDIAIISQITPDSIFSSFISNAFHTFFNGFASFTLEDVFTVKNNTGNTIIQYSQNMIKNLLNETEPMFSKGTANVNIQEFQILSIPYNCPNILIAADNVKTALQLNQLVIKKSDEVNCMSLTKVGAGYALYDNNVVKEIEPVYTNEATGPNKVNLHIEERFLKDLPNILIKSALSTGYINDHITKRNNETEKMYNALLDEGIIDDTSLYNPAAADQCAELLLAAPGAVNWENIRLIGDLNNRRSIVNKLKTDLWSANAGKRKFYRIGNLPNDPRQNVIENIARSGYSFELLKKQYDELSKLNILKNRVELPEYYIKAKLTGLIQNPDVDHIILCSVVNGDPDPKNIIVWDQKMQDGRNKIHKKVYYEEDSLYDFYVFKYFSKLLTSNEIDISYWINDIFDHTWKSMTSNAAAAKKMMQKIDTQKNIFDKRKISYENGSKTANTVDKKNSAQSVADFYGVCSDYCSEMTKNLQHVK